MKKLARNQSRDTTKTEALAREADRKDIGVTDVRVTDARVTDVSTGISTGISEVLNMRVGCWRAPVHLWTEPTAA